MLKEENDCCGCVVPAYPCMGESCPNRHVKHYYCDKCEEEIDPTELYKYDGMELCKDCLLEEFDTVK